MTDEKGVTRGEFEALIDKTELAWKKYHELYGVTVHGTRKQIAAMLELGVHRWLDKVLQERDEARAEARAYREIAIERDWGRGEGIAGRAEVTKDVDAEKQRIIDGWKKGQ